MVRSRRNFCRVLWSFVCVMPLPGLYRLVYLTIVDQSVYCKRCDLRTREETMTARERLIASAIEMLRRHGVAGTGLAELLENSGTARRSVYVNFPGGKSELMAEA